ncbi:MAG: ABC transporter ATP-binding protein/permease [Gemmatimonadota bacterium]|nr:ABC transporter ATP-binding protein/permease [Gemmatimonadota bacterium]
MTGSFHEEEALGKAEDLRQIRRLLRYLRPYRGTVALAILLLLGIAALQLVGPWLTMVALDRAIPAGDTRLLGLLAVGFAASLGLSFLFEYAQTLLTTWLGQRIMYDLRVEIFTHLQGLSLRFFDRNPVGRLMTRVTNDVEVLNETVSSGVVTIFGDVFTLLFILGAMLLLDWRLALVTFLVLPFVAAAAFVFRGLIRKAYRDIRVRLARINAYLQERLSGVRVVQYFSREPETARRFDEINRDHLDAHLRSITYYALFFPVIEVFTAVALALILWYGGLEVLEGTMTVGVIAAFLQYARRFFRPIQDLSEKYNILQGAIASSERIFTLLDTQPEIRDDPRPLSLPQAGRGEIEFRDVWFRYGGEEREARKEERESPLADSREREPEGEEGSGEGDEWVLRGVSFRVQPGERLAIVGATGAGKSTIINLLMRFYEPQRGEILFDGVAIHRVRRAELRERIGLVLQDVFLFSADVRSNIRMGREEISAERVREAAGRVGLDAVVARLPLGYDQPLGERGITISVGERQLVSFARALAFDPLVLVLDEATSSVDTELEARIEEALRELMRGRTSLVIAHRLSTVQGADQILVLHHGEIREQGTHEELLRKGGLYARLHELQFVRTPAA